MSVYYWKHSSFRMLGYKVFGVSFKKSRFIYKVFGLPVWSYKSELAQLLADVSESRSLDMREIDQQIEKLAFKSCDVKPMKAGSHNRVAYLASELYVSGGHTKCLREQIKLLKDDYEQGLFLTRYTTTKAGSQSVLDSIAEDAEICGEELTHITWKKDIINLYHKICHYAPKVLFVFIHPNDVYGAMLLALLKKNSDIGILYVLHASHFPNVGLSFSDLSLEGMPSTAWMTREQRKYLRTHVLGLVSKKIEDFPSFTSEQIAERKKMLGVREGEICTMSGGTAYKFFDAEGCSEYFQTVKKMLEARPHVRHIILSDFSEKQTAWIEKLFAGSAARERLELSPLSPTYELSFSCADVFLDSFPISAALTMIDLMRLRVPAVVKINTQNILWTFHEYQKPDYPYMFEKAEAFLEGALRLIDSEAERKRVAEENYDFYLSTYEGNACRKHLCTLIESHDDLGRCIDDAPALFTPRLQKQA